ncbi:class D sortase [Clostridium sp. D2Q-11]|uniref:Class D sortase n=2 Tax=Anaeromonas frigoriresistens TaxID=2683708 RepID=A0A942Z878_9FIRM|nr:class D sortase [Anaeromonas frigoriresistens]
MNNIDSNEEVTSNESDNTTFLDPTRADEKVSNEMKKEIINNETTKNAKNQEQKKTNKYLLKIDKIDLYLPILNGATDSNLDISLSRMNHTAKPGEIGNFAVAGHRSYTYGRHFNRLDEMKVGNRIDVITPDGNFKYKVTETFVVKPEELWVLKGNDKDKLITLVTCTPIRTATHRLIVRGKLIE